MKLEHPNRIDLFAMTPERNFWAGGEARRLADITRAYSDETVVWQESVYEEARSVADRLDIEKVVDVGVGGGQKLTAKFRGFGGELLQVDWADNREKTDSLELPRFVQANLEDGPDLDALLAEFRDRKRTLIILSDVIEHLDDPRLLLRTLRSALKLNPSNRLVISTPDRDRIDGKNSSLVPDNPTHIRQWNFNEFDLMLQSSGFRVDDIKYAPQNKFDEFDRTIIVEASCDDDFYAEFLQQQGLPPSSDHLVVTTEHSRALVTGGIGTYYQLAEEYSRRPRVTLYCGALGLPADWTRFVAENNWLHCAAVCGRSGAPLNEVASLDFQEILSAVLWLIFIYDEIRLIEYQDYQGIGVHIAQAKRARMLPGSVYLMVYAHGSHFYLDSAAGDISHKRELAVDVRERLSIELSDCVVFPSQFLRTMYLDAYGLSPRREVFQPYPIPAVEDAFLQNDYEKIDTLVFYGKHTQQKGYFDFCEAVLEIFQNPALRATAAKIKKIVVLGSTSPDPRLFEIAGVDVEFGIFARAEVIGRIRALATRSLIVLPYKGDNHPLSIFELVYANCQILAYRAGGIPEQIPLEFHDKVLCNPNRKALTDGLCRSVEMQFWERCELIKQIKASISWHYANHGKNYLQLVEAFKNCELRRQRPQCAGEVSVVVPNYNGSDALLSDALVGIRNSFKRPTAVIFVDDASSDENFKLLETKAGEISESDVKVIRNVSNLGLAGTRNVGLKNVGTPYVCAHDNDNVLLNRYLDVATRILDENPEVAAVTSWLIGFNDGDHWQAESTTTLKYQWRPLGSDLGLGLRENTFGDALAVYRVDALREVGGWDQSSKALWEDWHLFLRLAAAGKQIWVIPKPMFLYRVRANSMLRTYSNFDGWMRIANVFSEVPVNQRFGFVRAGVTPSSNFLKESAALEWAAHGLRSRIADLDAEVNRLLHFEHLARQFSSSRAYRTVRLYYRLYEHPATRWFMRPVRRAVGILRRGLTS